MGAKCLNQYRRLRADPSRVRVAIRRVEGNLWRCTVEVNDTDVSANIKTVYDATDAKPLEAIQRAVTAAYDPKAGVDIYMSYAFHHPWRSIGIGSKYRDEWDGAELEEDLWVVNGEV